jgi:gas vesicle protein
MSPTKKSSHFGAGLIAGALIGIGAALLAQTPKGKKMTKDMMKKASVIQSKLLKELKHGEKLTKAKYEDMVDTMTAYYLKSKDIVKAEVPEIKKFLMKNWALVEKQIKSVK